MWSLCWDFRLNLGGLLCFALIVCVALELVTSSSLFNFSELNMWLFQLLKVWTWWCILAIYLHFLLRVKISIWLVFSVLISPQTNSEWDLIRMNLHIKLLIVCIFTDTLVNQKKKKSHDALFFIGTNKEKLKTKSVNSKHLMQFSLYVFIAFIMLFYLWGEYMKKSHLDILLSVPLCFTQERKSYGFGTSWRVNK